MQKSPNGVKSSKMSKIFKFPDRRVGYEAVDEQLSSMLFSIRGTFGTDLPSNDVVREPLVDGFRPCFAPNGTMQLGQEGVREFTTRLNKIALPLYVKYYGWRQEMEVARTHDTEFHEDLLIAASILGERERRACPRNIHDVEVDVIGKFAASVAVQSMTKHGIMPRSIRSQTARSSGALEDALAQSDKLQVLDHMTHPLGKDLEETVYQATRQLRMRRGLVDG